MILRCLVPALLGVAGMAFGCDSDTSLGTVSGSSSVPVPEGHLAVSEDTLDFGWVCSGESAEASIVLRNTGAGVLNGLVALLSQEGNVGLDFQLAEPLTGGLAPGGELTALWTYTPTLQDDDEALWTITADDQTVSVVLSGREGGPALASPEVLDFGPVPVGTAEERTLKLTNSGEEDLVVASVQWIPDPLQPSSGVAWGGLPALPLSLEPGVAVDLPLSYTPDAFQEPSEEPLGVAMIVTDACSEAERAVPIHGWPGGVNVPCPVPPVVTENFVGKAVDVTDVLFVVDNSESMGSEQDQLAANFGAFISAADALGTDYRIGVTTTDVEAQGGALQGIPTVVTPANPEDFLEHVKVGVGGAKTEKGLQAAQLSLTSPQGFQPHIRPEAILVLIFVSDEPDSSPGTADTYRASYEALKPGAPERVIAHAIVGPPQAEGCPEAEYGPKYTQVAEDSGGIVASICEPSFADALVAFGEASFAARTRFVLAYAAVPGTVSVSVGGSPCVDGWSLDPDGKTVRFAVNSVCLPAGGQPLAVTYEMICLPDEP